MESHTMASENAEEQVSQNEARLRDRNTVEDCEKFCIVFRAHRTEAERKKSGT